MDDLPLVLWPGLSSRTWCSSGFLAQYDQASMNCTLVEQDKALALSLLGVPHMSIRLLEHPKVQHTLWSRLSQLTRLRSQRKEMQSDRTAPTELHHWKLETGTSFV